MPAAWSRLSTAARRSSRTSSPTSCARAATRWSWSRSRSPGTGRASLDQALQWRLIDLERGAEAGRARDRRRSSPPTGSGTRTRCLARPPVPAGLRLRPRASSASSRSRRSTARRGSPSSGSTGSPLGEARKIFTISGNVAERLKRYTGFDATVLPPPPQKLAYRTEGYDGFVLSVNRLDRYKRIDLLIEAAKADPALRAVIVGDGPDRGRLEQLASGMNGRIEFTGRVDGDDLADLYARCLAVYYAPVDEDYGMVPFEAFLSAKPVVTTVDAGGPLEVVHDGETGVVVGARPGRDRPRLRPPRPPRRRGARSRRGGQGGRRADHLGRLHRRAALVKVAYYSPMPPSHSGIADYSTLLLPALRERIEEVVVARAGKRAAARGHRALPRRQRPRGARLDRRRAPRASRRRRPARARPPPPDRRDHDRPRQRPRLPRRDGARLRRRRAACSGSASSTTCCR